jgi:hypothetical protein
MNGELLRLCRVEAKRDQLYGALVRQLSDLQIFTVVAIEDVHWADEATLDLLSYLGRRIQHLQVLLLVTYRNDGLMASNPLRLTLGALASQRARPASAGVVVLSRGWIALWTRRLTGIAEPIDLEPFTSQVAGDATHAAELWDRLGYRYEAALALMDTNDGPSFETC